MFQVKLDGNASYRLITEFSISASEDNSCANPSSVTNETQSVRPLAARFEADPGLVPFGLLGAVTPMLSPEYPGSQYGEALTSWAIEPYSWVSRIVYANARDGRSGVLGYKV